MWQPKFPKSNKPLFLAIADSVGDGIRNGELSEGDRLPTQRELAGILKVTVGTVNRAYVEARRRGLVRTTVGSGTYVLSSARLNQTGRVTSAAEDALSESLLRLANVQGLATKLISYRRTEVGLTEELCAEWLRALGLRVNSSEVLSFAGPHHAVSSVFASLLSRGDSILTEELTFPGVPPLALMHGIDVEGVKCDENGLIPEELAKKCKRINPRLLYLTPTLQMPTLATLTQQRREAVAEIARKFDFLILEDDCFLPMLPGSVTPIASLAPERTIHVSDLAYSLCASLRFACAYVPPHLAQRLRRGKRLTLIAPPTLDQAVITDWLAEGKHRSLLAARDKDLRERHGIAAECLRGKPLKSHPGTAYMWMPLAAPIRPNWFCSQAKEIGLEALPGEVFSVPGSAEVRGAHVSYAEASSPEELKRMLRSLDQLLDNAKPFDVPTEVYG